MMVLSVAAPVRAGTVLVLGDSLSAGYGLTPAQGWVALLEKRLAAQGYEYRVVNASVSGETSSGGLERLPRALKLHAPDIVIVELGANDGLRGLPIAVTRENLTRIVTLTQGSGAKVLLLGMRIPPNYGPRYTADFTQAFEEIAKRFKLAFVPFFLESVALKPNLIQADGLHPKAQAQPALLETVWPQLVRLIQKKPKKIK
jgi:acyl-CoA thioesterase-1